MRNLLLLCKIDFLRTWSKEKIITALVLTIFANGLAILISNIDFKGSTEMFNLPFTDYVMVLWRAIVPFSVLFFTAGIISHDIKNNWFRTVLIHSISRQDLIISKIVTAVLSVFIMMILLGVMPIISFGISSGSAIHFEFFKFINVTILWLLEAGLLTSIAVWLSCFLNGFFNLFLLASWMFLDTFIIHGIVSGWLKDSVSGNILMDFFFPSGFSESASIISNSGIFPYEYLLWGFCALAFFLSLSLFHFNRLIIDKNTD